MTNQNPTEKDAKILRIPSRDAVEKIAEPQEIARELTDDEIAAVAGGTGGASTTKMSKM